MLVLPVGVIVVVTSVICIKKILFPEKDEKISGAIIILMFVAVFGIPIVVSAGVAEIPSFMGDGGDSGDWIGFWGSFLGSIIGVAGAALFAYINTNFQLKEQRRNDLFNALEIEDVKNKSKLISINTNYLKEIVGLELSIGNFNLSEATDIYGIRSYVNRDRIVQQNNVRNTYIAEFTAYITCIGGSTLKEFRTIQDDIHDTWSELVEKNMLELNDAVREVVTQLDNGDSFEIDSYRELALKQNTVVSNLKYIEAKVEIMNNSLANDITNKRKF
ncbi:hypothetical protein [Latilactobacillus sakei]|uniref:hypothetical protein n=1 Tax=Latilactobacillus sakei TaxID=1599 RepID=UPI000977AFF1|nr:hypothetical protein [Latilactobacillus sakei]